MTDPFQQMFQNARRDMAAGQQEAFEERIVKQLLRYAGVVINIGEAVNEARRVYGSPSLNFRWFNDTYHFPIKLLAQKLPYTHKATLPDIYGQGNFKRLPWWKEYEEQVDKNDIDLQAERAALFFNLPHAREAFTMVLHNQPLQGGVVLADAEHRQDQPWPRTTFPLGKSGIVAVLEAFPSFMQTVGTAWTDV